MLGMSWAGRAVPPPREAGRAFVWAVLRGALITPPMHDSPPCRAGRTVPESVQSASAIAPMPASRTDQGRPFPLPQYHPRHERKQPDLSVSHWSLAAVQGRRMVVRAVWGESRRVGIRYGHERRRQRYSAVLAFCLQDAPSPPTFPQFRLPIPCVPREFAALLSTQSRTFHARTLPFP
uniref:Uncharacterized protein n=1 Tax=Mycena chlorophos TaxID=658473 RepID=A0ABQ0LTS2_MYCCL|nr:predicted protein [Mycena chlorophos]